MDARRYDIDWLRVSATLAVFVFHNVHLFDVVDWHVKDAAQSTAATIFIGALDSWLMPLFFLLSGTGTWYALARRSAKAYCRERFKRLAIPYWIAGGLILLPPQLWLERLTHGRFSGGFPEFYPHFFDTLHFGIMPPFILFWPGHLWFLSYLLTVSLLTLPLTLYLRRGRDGEAGAALGRLLSGRWWGPFAPAPLLFAIQLALRGLSPEQHGPAGLACFAVFFVWGFLLPSGGDAYMRRCRKLILPSLALASAMFGVEGLMVLGRGYPYPEGQSFTPLAPYILFQAVMSLQAVCWITAALGLASRFLNRPSPRLKAMNEAVLPFYMLHQTAILLTAYWVVGLDWAAPAKLLLNATASFTAIILAYLLCIRPLNPIRFIFGMRPRG